MRGPGAHGPHAVGARKNSLERASARLLLQPSKEKDESVDGRASASKSRRQLDLQDGAQRRVSRVGPGSKCGGWDGDRRRFGTRLASKNKSQVDDDVVRARQKSNSSARLSVWSAVWKSILRTWKRDTVGCLGLWVARRHQIAARSMPCAPSGEDGHFSVAARGHTQNGGRRADGLSKGMAGGAPSAGESLGPSTLISTSDSPFWSCASPGAACAGLRGDDGDHVVAAR